VRAVVERRTVGYDAAVRAPAVGVDEAETLGVTASGVPADAPFWPPAEDADDDGLSRAAAMPQTLQ
jgi:hypothetical protein